jgi:hypothetical protein
MTDISTIYNGIIIVQTIALVIASYVIVKLTNEADRLADIIRKFNHD